MPKFETHRLPSARVRVWMSVASQKWERMDLVSFDRQQKSDGSLRRRTNYRGFRALRNAADILSSAGREFWRRTRPMAASGPPPPPSTRSQAKRIPRVATSSEGGNQVTAQKNCRASARVLTGRLTGATGCFRCFCRFTHAQLRPECTNSRRGRRNTQERRGDTRVGVTY